MQPNDFQLTAALAVFVFVILVIARPTLFIRWLIAPLLPPQIFCGITQKKCLSLTVDDGPSGMGSDLLLEALKRHKVKATFFLIGSHLQEAEGFAERALAQGHTVGHHMLVDSRSACLDPRSFTQQFILTEQLIYQQLSESETPKWFRPGGGWFHKKMLNWVARRGYKLVLGSIFPWDTFYPPVCFLKAFLCWNAHPGGIIVMHDRPDTIKATIAALEWVLPRLKQSGYDFVTLDDLLKP